MALRFYGAYDSLRTLYLNDTTVDPFNRRELISGDVLAIEFGLLKRTGDDLANPPIWERQLAAGYSLEIIVLKSSDRTQLTYANTFTNLDEHLKTGPLSLDTSEIATALTSVNEVDVIFAARIQAGTNKHTIYYGDWSLKKSLITAAPSVPAAGEVTATQSWALGNFMPRDGTGAANPTKDFYMLDETGARKYQVKIVNGQLVCTEF